MDEEGVRSNRADPFLIPLFCATLRVMAYDEEMAARVRDILAVEPDLTERKMFGGLGFMLAGNMAVAAGSLGRLMVRVDPAEAEELLRTDGVGPMVMRDRELAGWLLVEPDALVSEEEMERWVGVGADYVRTLPPK